MSRMKSREAMELKRQVESLAAQHGYLPGVSSDYMEAKSDERDSYKVVIRTQGNPGTKEQFMEELRQAGIDAQNEQIDFRETSPSKAPPRSVDGGSQVPGR